MKGKSNRDISKSSMMICLCQTKYDSTPGLKTRTPESVRRREKIMLMAGEKMILIGYGFREG